MAQRKWYFNKIYIWLGCFDGYRKSWFAEEKTLWVNFKSVIGDFFWKMLVTWRFCRPSRRAIWLTRTKHTASKGWTFNWLTSLWRNQSHWSLGPLKVSTHIPVPPPCVGGYPQWGCKHTDWLLLFPKASLQANTQIQIRNTYIWATLPSNDCILLSSPEIYIALHTVLSGRAEGLNL